MPDDDSNVIPLTVQRGRRVGNLVVYSDADLKTAVPRDYLMKGVICPSELSSWYGVPGCGKSFLAGYIGRGIARGSERLFGCRVHKANVLFLALEGAAGFENRLRADVNANKEVEDFYYVAQPVNLFSDVTARTQVIEAAKTCEAALIIIDTLNRAIAEGSENTPEDMGRFISNIDQIRLATSAHVMVIHHSGKDAGRGMRGHSALLGASDVVVEITKSAQNGEPRTATIEKAKDDQDGWSFSFDLERVVLGIDGDGDEITTCLVRETGESSPAKKPKKAALTPQETDWFQALEALLEREDKTQLIKPSREFSVTVRVATRATVREWFREWGFIGVTENVTGSTALSDKDRQELKRMLNTLRSKKKIRIQKDYIWLNRDTP